MFSPVIWIVKFILTRILDPHLPHLSYVFVTPWEPKELTRQNNSRNPTDRLGDSIGITCLVLLVEVVKHEVGVVAAPRLGNLH